MPVWPAPSVRERYWGLHPSVAAFGRGPGWLPPFPHGYGAPTYNVRAGELGQGGAFIQMDPGYTEAPAYGEVIPRLRRPLTTSASFPRDPATGAALPNAADPILAGSRQDPFGFTIPQFADQEYSARLAEASRVLAGFARRTLDAITRDHWRRRHARVLETW